MVRAGLSSAALAEVAGDVDVCRFTSVPMVFSISACEEWVRRQERRRIAGTGVTLAIVSPGSLPVGSVNVSIDNCGGHRGHLGYWLVPRARGRGLATASARAMAIWAMENLDLTRIELAIRPDNVASQRVAQKIGAVAEAFAGAAMKPKGRGGTC